MAMIIAVSSSPFGSLLEVTEPESPRGAEPSETEGPANEPAEADAPSADAAAYAVPDDERPASETSSAEIPSEHAPSREASAEVAPVARTIVVAEREPTRPRRDSIFDAGYGTRRQITVAIGGLADALDPRAAAGASLRVPQFTSDARFGLGRGWSLVAHLNTILAINELTLGVSWSFPVFRELRGVVQAQGGISLGMLGSFGFASTVLAPEFRPLVGLSLPSGSMRWSLRGEIVFAGPYFASLGETSSTLATPPPIANWNIALILENLLKNNHLWYAGVMMMGSTAMYQNWLLFPDTSHFDYYPRLVGGYEF